MRRDLPDEAWSTPGQFLSPDGRTYRRRTTRISRGEAEAMAEGGCPVLTYLPGGRLVWHDEDDAWPAWADARTSFTTGLPGPDAPVTASASPAISSDSCTPTSSSC